MEYGPGRESGKISYQIGMLARAHRLLLAKSQVKGGEPFLHIQRKWLETFYAENKGLIWAVGILFTVGGTVLKLFLG
jgi:hypothetical protein